MSNVSLEDQGFYYDQQSGHNFPLFHPPLVEAWSITVSGFIFCSISLILYLRIVYIIYRDKSGSFSNPFYVLVVHLAIPDCLFLFIQMIIGYPVPMIGFKKVSHDFIAAMGYCVTSSSWAAAIIVLLIGINRYVAICHFASYKALFSNLRVHVMCAIVWIFSLSVTASYYLCSCLNFKVGYAWKYTCLGYKCAMFVYYITYPTWGLLTSLVPFLYFIIFFHYQWKKCHLSDTLNRENKIGKKDLLMLIQFIVISAVLFLNFIIFFNFQGFADTKYGDILYSSFNCVNAAVNPYLYFLCNSEIRKGFFNRKTNAVGHSSISTRQNKATVSTNISVNPKVGQEEIQV